jgi:hypothetical protein
VIPRERTEDLLSLFLFNTFSTGPVHECRARAGTDSYEETGGSWDWASENPPVSGFADAVKCLMLATEFVQLGVSGIR